MDKDTISKFNKAEEYFKKFKGETAYLPVGFCERTMENSYSDGVFCRIEKGYGNNAKIGPYMSFLISETVKEGEYKGDVKSTLRLVGYLANENGEKELTFVEYGALEYSPVSFSCFSVRKTEYGAHLREEGDAIKDFSALWSGTHLAMIDTKVRDISKVPGSEETGQDDNMEE